MNPASANPEPASGFSKRIAQAIDGLLYISESEALVELLPWPAVNDKKTLQQAITAQFALPPEQQEEISTGIFLNPFQSGSDGDTLLQDLANRFEALFTLLQSDGNTLTIIRGGKKMVHYFLASFGPAGDAVLHTTAVET